MTNITYIKNIIVGYGFSAIPIVREFQRHSDEFAIISEKDTVWRALHKNGRLNFDLVSSRLTSFYSFDLVNDLDKDTFPTAKEFFEYQRRYFEKNESNIINDFVTHIENHDDHSILYCKSGDVYKASNVIIATGYQRRITTDILHFDTSIKNKTIVFTTIGDTANMLIAQLIRNNNTIYVLNNGFATVDKVFRVNKTLVTLDQQEAHNVSFHFPRSYLDTTEGTFLGIGLNVAPKYNADIYLNYWKMVFTKTSLGLIKRFFLGLILFFRSINMLISRIFEHGLSTSKLPTLRFTSIDNFPSGSIPNNYMFIKYWPLDTYYEEHHRHLEASIKDGYLVNDLPFFINEGLVHQFPKRKTDIDREKKEITYKSKTIAYDYIIDGGPESSRAPRIIQASTGTEFTLVYKELYMGVLPQKLNNIYFMGLSRPMSGGVANLNEMQSIFIHTMISEPHVRSTIMATISDRIQQYNRRYYKCYAPNKADHHVYSGTYNEEVARILGINHRLSDCRSLRDLNHYFFFPNNTFKYRLQGKYKIDSVQKLIEFSNNEYDSYSLVKYFFFTYWMYRIIYAEMSLVLYVFGYLPLWGFILLLVIQILNSKLFVLFTQYFHGRSKCAVLLLVAFLIPFIHPSYYPFLILTDWVLTFSVRQAGARAILNDLKVKNRYRSFFYETYLPTLRKVFGK